MPSKSLPVCSIKRAEQFLFHNLSGEHVFPCRDSSLLILIFGRSTLVDRMRQQYFAFFHHCSWSWSTCWSHQGHTKAGVVGADACNEVTCESSLLIISRIFCAHYRGRTNHSKTSQFIPCHCKSSCCLLTQWCVLPVAAFVTVLIREPDPPSL